MPNLNNVDTKQAAGAHNGLLGDTPQKAYVTKLDLFNRFAEPELREVIAGLDLSPTSRVLDAGCGTGLITSWLAEQVPAGLVELLDLLVELRDGEELDQMARVDWSRVLDSGTLELVREGQIVEAKERLEACLL